ncbi:hypothetical protein, partial [Hymenobacter negativus]|uniref:hypothetical protein n=1 Tax=Hymenobacter negativus TaxID=2795026 RepID=UPI001BB43E97
SVWARAGSQPLTPLSNNRKNKNRLAERKRRIKGKSAARIIAANYATKAGGLDDKNGVLGKNNGHTN